MTETTMFVDEFDRPTPIQRAAGKIFLKAADEINALFDGRGMGKSWFWIRTVKFLIYKDMGVRMWVERIIRNRQSFSHFHGERWDG